MSKDQQANLIVRAALLNYADAAEYLGTSERHLHRLVGERRIPFVKLGARFVRFQVDALDVWIDENTTAAVR